LGDSITSSTRTRFSVHTGPHASILGEGCTGLARRRSRRAHTLSSNPERAASPICPDLISTGTRAYAARKPQIWWR
jgi:hypothetical protein